MNKSELIEAIAIQTGLPKAKAELVINALIATIKVELQNGDAVALVGFGTFSVKERAARTGRNPKTGEAIDIPASKVPDFKAGKGLKDAVK